MTDEKTICVGNRFLGMDRPHDKPFANLVAFYHVGVTPDALVKVGSNAPVHIRSPSKSYELYLTPISVVQTAFKIDGNPTCLTMVCVSMPRFNKEPIRLETRTMVDGYNKAVATYGPFVKSITFVVNPLFELVLNGKVPHSVTKV